MTRRMASGDIFTQMVRLTLVNGKIMRGKDKVNTLGLADKSTSVNGKVARSTDKLFKLGLTDKGTKEALKMA